MSRRSFLRSAAMAISGMAVGGLPFLKGGNTAAPGNPPFGLQLYTLRDVIAADPEAVLRQVADFGYRQIESYEGPRGMFWGMGNVGFKKFLNDHGMTPISTHANVFNDFERKAGEAAEIGMKYIVCPWIGSRDSLDKYREMADTFNNLGQIAKGAGIRFSYHNHDYTFKPKDEELPQDILMQRTDPDLVDFQVDIYWVELAGQNTMEWIRKYPGRFTSSHVKDLAKGRTPESTVLGTGTIDFPAILPVAKANGMKYFIVEQEAYTNTTPIDAVRKNAAYMQQLRI